MKLIDKSVDYTLAVLYRLWAWLGRKLNVTLTETRWVQVPVPVDRPETQETLAKLVAENDDLTQECLQLQERVVELADEADKMETKLKQAIWALDRHHSHEPTGPNRPNNNRKLTEREVREIREHSRMGWKNADLARAFDVNPATISRIIRGQYHKKKGL